MKNLKDHYHYTECGLDFIFLANGFKYVNGNKGSGVIIQNIDGLHKAIGLLLVDQKKDLDGKDIRFLRHEMGMSQSVLARLLEVGEQTVRRWENGTSETNKPAEALIKLLYKEHIKQDSAIRANLKRMADIEDEIDKTKRGGFVLQNTAKEWKEAA